MPRKSLTASRWHLAFALVLILLKYRSSNAADEVSSVHPKFLGANSCAAASCHGGGGSHQNQHLVWSLRDFHFQRPYATLTTARSKQISAALQIKDATTAAECISCHAPLREVPETLRAEPLRATEGVSCETCHGPGENWLRSHTRSDYTHADRVQTGMRDLKNLYVRANTCVACHQNVPLPLRQAGHPELIFELDGQAVSQPKHWREKENFDGAQAWAVGQAVALREMLWQLERSEKNDERLTASAEALLWLFEKIENAGLASGQTARAKLKEARAAADILARDFAESPWTAQKNKSILSALTKVSADFKQPSSFPEQHARRGERLVLALDRVAKPPPGSKTETELKKLFAIAQSIPDFNAANFADALEEFARSL